ncbi:uncharacterized protein LOC113122143 [Mastacembelus armatus]|uniref:uncharacterized protein LOC113122143 n=1 Tax=Mastacembelus armatus TaxID=205130 RepID=UPI000E453BF1|nr:uncharacterized protein LOC113122143 [Mastacembelus armatus]
MPQLKAKTQCSVVGCTNQHKIMYLIPSTEDVKAQWLSFIYSGNVPTDTPKILHACANHFSVDCFLNVGQYKAGFASRLILKPGSLPTVATTDPGASTNVKQTIQPAVRHVASQTDPPERRSVSTQKNYKKLHRSAATQTRVESRDCGVCTLTFPLDSPVLFPQPTILDSPSKRPRFDLTNEEEGLSECSLPEVVHEPEKLT